VRSTAPWLSASYGSRDVAEIADRTPHFQPVAERNAKVTHLAGKSKNLLSKPS
jgi:hypothetical protein